MNKQLNELNQKADKIIAKINPQQKLILAIITPIFLFIIFRVLAQLAAGFHGNNSTFGFSEYTWWVWLIYCFVVGVIEFKLFDNPKI